MTGDDDDMYMPITRERHQPAAAGITENIDQYTCTPGHADQNDGSPIPVPTATDTTNFCPSLEAPPPPPRKRKVASVVTEDILDDLMICSDDSCRELIEENDLLTCIAPGCGQNVSSLISRHPNCLIFF